MKIGIDVRLWNETGVGRYIRNLVIELGNLDKESQYVLFGLQKDIPEIRNQISGFKNFIIIESNIRWHSIQEQIAFPRLLNKYKLDLVHFPYFSVPVFYKKPYVVTVHDLIINNFPTGRASTLPYPIYKLKTLGYEFVLKRALHDAKKVIVPSEATCEEIIKHYKREIKSSKIIVTPEGVDDAFSDFAPNLFKPKSPYFLYVGNAYPHKNLDKFLDAFKLFSVNSSQFTVKLVGKEDYFYKKLKSWAKKENVQGVEFLGYVSDEELSKLYVNATATFIPSLMEGFGLTALEAMKMGSLVACSKIPSLEEVCGKDAFYFDPNDIISMIKAMEDILAISDKDKKTKLDLSKKHAEKYSFPKTAKLTLDVYNSCLHTNS